LNDTAGLSLAESPPLGKAPGSLPSAALLLLANLVPLYGVLFWDWDVFSLLLLFWMENLAIGALNVARMLCAQPGDILAWLRKLFLVPFFCVHYGMFTAVHGMFVLSGMFGSRDYTSGGFAVIGPALEAAAEQDLWLPVAALAASHLFSFFWNYVHRGEYRRTTPAALMVRPYVRVVALHFAIVVGGIGAMALGSPVSALVLLVAIKTGIDVAAHLREHRASA
jgi:hypothetical protein